MKVIKQEDIGELLLLPLPTVDGARPVPGLYRPLKSLLTMMVDLFTSNARMRASLAWFCEPDTLFYAVGSDGAPRGDEEMTLWTVSLLNRQRRVGSPHDNFLQVVAGCGESHEVMLQYARNLGDEITALDIYISKTCTEPSSATSTCR